MRASLHHLPVALLTTAVALLAGEARSVSAQTIQGRLVEMSTDKPLSGASVMLLSEPGTQPAVAARADRNGGFTVTAPAPGVYRLRVDLPGYRTAVTPAIALGPGDQVSLTLRDIPDVAMMRPMTVTASNRRPAGRLGGFLDRMQRGIGGRFITRDQIEKTHPIRVSDLLRTIPGLTVIPTAFGDVVQTTEGCTPDVYVDGVSFPLRYETIDDIVSPTDLEGIEVYPHAVEAPPQFQRPGSSCGAIVLWTRGSL